MPVGSLVAREGVEWTHRAVPGHPGGTSFDAEQGWAAVSTALRSVVDALSGREIVAVAASSMREGFVLFDEEGTELFACPNTDGRARVEAEELVSEGLADDIYAVGGDWVSITAPARIRWIARHEGEILERARHLGMLSDWVNRRLTGRYATDPTCGSSTALFDLAARTWSADLVARVGLDPRILPPVLEPGTVLGAVTADASAQTGLPVDTPVVMGGADTQLALHAIGAGSGRPTIVAGTFWQTTAVVGEPLVDLRRRTRTLCHVDPSSWMVEGIGFLSGLAMRWFRDGFCPDAVELARGRGISAFDVMESWAAEVPVGSDGLVAVLSDVMQADAWHHAAPALVGFDISDARRFHRGTVVRAIEEAAAFVAAGHLRILDEMTGGAASSSGEATFTGGSSAGVLWPRIIAGATGMTTRTTEAPEATSYGAARLAAAAVGIDLPPLLHDADPVRPAADERIAYTQAAERWREVYAAQRTATAAAHLPALFTHDAIDEFLDDMKNGGNAAATVAIHGSWFGGYNVVRLYDAFKGQSYTPAESMMFQDSLTVDTADAASKYQEVVYKADPLPFDWKAMSRAEAGKEWDTQIPLRPIDPTEYWGRIGEPAPVGYVMPEALKKDLDGGAVETLSELYLSHATENPLGAVIDLTRSRSSSFGQK